MLKIILLVIVFIIIGVLVYASTKPDTFTIVRKATINATPEALFAQINDFKNWQAWSPYEKKDLNMKRKLSGSDSGLGAIYEWDGDNNVGQGRMEILESIASQKVVIKLDFFKPFEAHNMAVFTFTQSSTGVEVVWEMNGPQVFIGKIMCLFMDMDKMVGTDFEVGLQNLKSLTEVKSQ